MQEHGAGWIMSQEEWVDEAQMLQRILMLLDPVHHEALQEKAACASRVLLPTMENMVAATVACYEQAIATTPRVFERSSFPPVRVRGALGYAGYSLESHAEAEDKGTLWWQWAVRFRKTSVGRVFRALLPRGVVDGLKKFIKR
jgi:hypothetical protein